MNLDTKTAQRKIARKRYTAARQAIKHMRKVYLRDKTEESRERLIQALKKSGNIYQELN